MTHNAVISMTYADSGLGAMVWGDKPGDNWVSAGAMRPVPDPGIVQGRARHAPSAAQGTHRPLYRGGRGGLATPARARVGSPYAFHFKIFGH